ncbi:hypothetical protein RBB75_04165 [Tunturibacter empetritectus]|uniref:DUF2637 domain-containing protein n=1 Tax=Tunturiibacter empetritectus TaxID=3069691 RepID=A0AAU7ZEW1_9BACT
MTVTKTDALAVRLIISLTVAVTAFLAMFFVFNFAFIRWAVWRYPQHNSMAGLTAFVYGLPVAADCAIFGFAIAFRRASRVKAS